MVFDSANLKLPRVVSYPPEATVWVSGGLYAS
jgi:hypothetical protein